VAGFKKDKPAPGTGMVLLYLWESVGKVLSSAGIRLNKKMHINCGSSARMAGIVCVNEDQIRRQDRWNNTTVNGAYLTSLPREIMRSMSGFPTMVNRFILHVPSLTHLPTSAKS
jgi:hypothetical protein